MDLNKSRLEQAIYNANEFLMEDPELPIVKVALFGEPICNRLQQLLHRRDPFSACRAKGGSGRLAGGWIARQNHRRLVESHFVAGDAVVLAVIARRALTSRVDCQSVESALCRTCRWPIT